MSNIEQIAKTKMSNMQEEMKMGRTDDDDDDHHIIDEQQQGKDDDDVVVNIVEDVSNEGPAAAATIVHHRDQLPAAAAGRPNNKFTLFGRDMLFWTLVLASSAALALGLSLVSVLGRLYFVHGGSSRWLYTWIATTGWPILLPPLLFCYRTYSIAPTPLTPRLALTYVLMGFLTAADDLLFAWGISYLPLSTNSLLSSSQLVFTALFAYAIVGQKMTSYILNSILLITTGAVLLAVSSHSDRPAGTTKKEYIIGVVVTIASSALFALLLPLIELIYRKVVGKASFVRVMEVVVGVSFTASVFAFIGMWAAGDLGAVKKDAMAFDLGTSKYINTLIWSAVGCQLYAVGGAGFIFLGSSLMACSLMTAIIPVLPLFAVAFFHDSFSVVKAIAMLLSVWGFISYVYGGYLQQRKAHDGRVSSSSVSQ